MGKMTGKACRIVAMMSMTLSFFLVELIVGYLSNSLALVADSFHMLSDVVALIVGLVSVRISRKGASKYNTFGWARAEVVGALVNAVFLVALCFTIMVEAIKRLITPESIDDATQLLIVGGIGLAVNIIGLFLFHDHAHGHSHGGHGHSHGGHSHNTHSHKDRSHVNNNIPETEPLETGARKEDAGSSGSSESSEIDLGLVEQHDGTIANVKLHSDKKQASAQQLNMRGVFLHVLGDALGSVVVMISATVTKLVRIYSSQCDGIVTNTTTPAEENITLIVRSINESHIHSDAHHHPCVYEDALWVKCIDPILSMVLVGIILSTSVPLLKESGRILLQTVPTHVVVAAMKEQIEKMEGVISVHEFYVWTLSGNRVIASLHLIMDTVDDYHSTCSRLHEFFLDNGVHSVTIQPEFLEYYARSDAGKRCQLECGSSKGCRHLTRCMIKENMESQTKLHEISSHTAPA